ncbi:Histone deacetylase hda1 [Didymella heteroderae]|uniref:histone deacetylase n=1 Tax=Didymella heteroderae TaxID=1769908 RepID=A0A9P5BWL9_9PLEO|nr:Histone deacetylase hda1 [Didymella heteroderae]
MNDEDVPMEDEIIASTEINNGPTDYAPEFVIPTDVFANPNMAHLPKNARLPLLESPLIARPTSHYADSRSDMMDITRATPHRHSSPHVRIPPKATSQALPIATLKTGLVYDPRMRFHAELPNETTIDDIHPEDPRRIHSIFEEIREAGLVRGPESSETEDHNDYCWRIGIRAAEKHEILLVHTLEHYEFVSSLPHMTLEELSHQGQLRDSIYFNHSTYDCARLAAGGAIEACKAVVQGSVRNAIAIIRPPGHHAESDSPSGFCIFNNVPIAARVCQDAYPQTCRKVLILDWDVHHGNGIQHAFYDDPNVLYISLHVFRGGNFYPNLPDGDLTYCGEGAGIGKNVNIPWEEHGMGDAEYLYAFQEVVMPIANNGRANALLWNMTFEHNVIATPDFMERKPLLVILHDPPSFQDHPDPVTGRRELHNTWLTDVTKSYIDWAIENDFSVIDVNVPKFVAVESEEVGSNLGFTKADDQKVRADRTREIANYLWTNYIEPNNATQVFFMGIGDAYLGLVDLLSRNETTTEETSKLELIIGFVAESAISSVKRINTDDDIGLWYHQHTKIFVKQSHYAFNRNSTKKLRKKLGDLQQSNWDTLDDMLVGHRLEVQDLLLEKKNEYIEDTENSTPDEDQQAALNGGFRSPPLGLDTQAIKARHANGLRGLPPVGVFSSPVPRSPRSPMGFGKPF